jgi:hypothetical protein
MPYKDLKLNRNVVVLHDALTRPLKVFENNLGTI